MTFVVLGHTSLAHAFLTCSCNQYCPSPLVHAHTWKVVCLRDLYMRTPGGGALAGFKGFGVTKNLKWFLNNKVVSTISFDT